MTRLDVSAWLSDPGLARLFDSLEPLGGARFIGGAVRDLLLGMPHADLDLATPAPPEAVIGAARAAGFRVVATGLGHGTVTVVLPQGPVEVTTLRRDVATDGRHAEVAFTADWKEDAARRDFTINALSANREGTLFDYFDGIADLQARRVRFIGDPVARIREDTLRILRFFRFSARYADTLDEAALEAIRATSAGMGNLSGERILSEILKLLASPRAPDMWRAMMETGVVAAVLPEATDIARLQRLVALEEDLSNPDPFRRLMALLPAPCEAKAIARRLKLSAAQRKRLEQAALPPECQAHLEAGDWAKALYGADPVSVMDAALLQAAAGTLPGKQAKQLVRFAATWTPPKFPLGGDNLKELGLQPGPVFGALLREVERWWIARDFQPTRQQCFAELKRIWKIYKQNQ